MGIKKYLVAALVLPAIIVAISCKKDENNNVDLTKNVVGTYEGTLSDVSLKDVVDASSQITRMDHNTIEIWCTSSIFDTTFVMELFENADSMILCNIGDDFVNEYGHDRMDDHHMMGDQGWQDWSHHMSEEHGPNDEHYGSFNMIEHSFDYKFVFDTDSTLYFKGKRK